MVNLTFGEQVKIVLNRKGMTIKDLAELIEERTGMKMSRQNLTQRLGRDNFQEQDMRQIAEILGCPFYLNILTEDKTLKKNAPKDKEEAKDQETKEIPEPIEITVGDLLDLTKVREQEEAEAESRKAALEKENPQTVEAKEAEDDEKAQIADKEEAEDTAEEKEKKEKEPQLGEINPYTRREYETNSVRTHPKHIGYVQVYDRAEHKWTDMTEWAFLGYQERKKRLLGKKYEPPIYLD